MIVGELMKKWLSGAILILGIALALIVLRTAFSMAGTDYRPQHGDVIFQMLANSRLMEMIAGTTGSDYTHCGIVEYRYGNWWVIEAVGPVRSIRMESWIKRGRDKGFAVYRLKNTEDAAINKFIAAANTYLGRPYDIRYRFDDEYIYCSELVFKAYRTATGDDLGEIVQLKDLNWQPYTNLIRELEMGGPVPLERKIITPLHLAQAEQLEFVFARDIELLTR